jgi:tight adherence protein B
MVSATFIFALSLIAGLAVYGTVRYGIPALSGWYLARIGRLEAELTKRFSELFIVDWPPRLLAHLMFFRIPLVALAVYAITSTLVFALGAGAAAYFAPDWILRYYKAKRMDRFDEQLVDALTLLANSARAGLSLVQALETTASKLPAPASQEFGLLLKEYQHGTPIERVLVNARTRLARPNFSIVATALIVNREKGGNLIEVLDKISTSLREITRLEKKIQTETASVRFSAQLMAFMPATVGCIFYLIEPSSMQLLFTDFIGSIILFFVVLLNVVALVIIQRIVSVDI